jgi:hypothetical protein
MSRSTDPKTKKLTGFFYEDEHRSIKSDCAKLGKTFTDYVLLLRKAYNANPPLRVSDLLKKKDKKVSAS